MNTPLKLEWDFFDHESSDAWQTRLQQTSSRATVKTAQRDYRFLPLWLGIALLALLLWARFWPNSEVVSQPEQVLTAQPTFQQSTTTRTATQSNQWGRLPEAIGGGEIDVENLGTHPGDDLERDPSMATANRACTLFCSCANYHLPNCMTPKTLSAENSQQVTNEQK